MVTYDKSEDPYTFSSTKDSYASIDDLSGDTLKIRNDNEKPGGSNKCEDCFIIIHKKNKTNVSFYLFTLNICR
ncbi:unnamed protein product [Rotaria socialis]